MVKKERYPEYFEHRPFSRWHREKLGEKCLATDLDFIEYRRDRGIVAFLEVKQRGSLTWWQKLVLTELSEKTGVPFYFIRHNEDLTKFDVYESLKSPKPIKWQINEEEMIKFIKEL